MVDLLRESQVTSTPGTAIDRENGRKDRERYRIGSAAGLMILSKN
jgi:hypothetical protein